MKDETGSAHMTQGSLTSFVRNRFGCGNSALALNGGWTQVPSGIYFNTPEFTISVWVYPLNIGSWARVIDFGSGPSAENIALALSFTTSLQPSLYIVSGLSDPLFIARSSQKLVLNQWLMLAVTFDGTNTCIYLNGTLAVNYYFQGYTPLTLLRSKCFIGKSNWNGDGYSSSYLDDLRFYNKSLTQSEILEIMNRNETSKTRKKY
jgi:hypothetical protein